jgi:hypothetical protein
VGGHKGLVIGLALADPAQLVAVFLHPHTPAGLPGSKAI